MPNRMIQNSIKTSESINSLSWFAEVVFYRLLLVVDNYGRTDGRLVLLRNSLFPSRDDVTTDMLKKAIDELADTGTVLEYTVDGKQYLCFPKFSQYQRLRSKSSDFPAPPGVVDTLTTRVGHMSSKCRLEVEEEVEDEVEKEVEEEHIVDDERVRDIESEANSGCCSGTRGEIVAKSTDCNGVRDEIADDNYSKVRDNAVIVLNYLNSSADTKYRNCESTLRPIIARLNEKYSVDDCRSVINKKCTEWSGTDMARYLRPSTLFSKSHFEEYLNAPVSVKRSYQNCSRKVSMPDYWGKEQEKETMSDEEMRNLLKLQEEMSK